MKEREAKIEINLSMQNLLDKSTLWVLLAPVEYHSLVAKRANYDGMEYFPFRLPHLQVTTKILTRSALNNIRSAHQSFRTERTFQEVRKHPNPKLAAFAFVTLPEKFSSLKDLQILQMLLGQGLPVVVYPPNEWMGEKKPEAFSILRNKLIQPAPELLEAWNVNSLEAFAEEAQRRGYKLCLDLFHIRRGPTQGFSTKFGPWQEVLPVLLPYTREVHLGVGRSDFKGKFNSMQELRDLYVGERKTEIVPMLEFIKDFSWKGPIVTEIPASGINELFSPRKILTPNAVIKTHTQIVQNIRNIFDK